MLYLRVNKNCRRRTQEQSKANCVHEEFEKSLAIPAATAPGDGEVISVLGTSGTALAANPASGFVSPWIGELARVGFRDT